MADSTISFKRDIIYSVAPKCKLPLTIQNTSVDLLYFADINKLEEESDDLVWFTLQPGDTLKFHTPLLFKQTTVGVLKYPIHSDCKKGAYVMNAVEFGAPPSNVYDDSSYISFELSSEVDLDGRWVISYNCTNTLQFSNDSLDSIGIEKVVATSDFLFLKDSQGHFTGVLSVGGIMIPAADTEVLDSGRLAFVYDEVLYAGTHITVYQK